MTAPVRDAMIVAGGRGTRLQPLTYTTHKPLLPFCGAPFLAGVIQRLAAAGVTRVFLVVGADTEPFDVLRPDAREHGVELEMVPEPEPLDTAGGVRVAAEQLDDAFFVLNGDILTDVPFADVGAAHRERDADATLVLHRVDDTSTFGVCVRDGTRIVEFVEKPPAGTLPGQDTINAGTYVLEPSAVATFPVGEPLSFERTVFPGILAQGGHIEGFVWEGVWTDLGTPERWRAGHRLALDGEMDWPTLAGVPEWGPGVRVASDAHVADGASLQPPVLVLPQARIAAGAAVGPYVVVGAGDHIRERVSLANSVLGDDVEIGADVIADGLVTGTEVTIEPGVRLGRNVVLGDGERLTAGTAVPDEARIPPREG